MVGLLVCVIASPAGWVPRSGVSKPRGVPFRALWQSPVITRLPVLAAGQGFVGSRASSQWQIK